MHRLIEKYWRDWFPRLPSYQTFVLRLNRLEPTFQTFGAVLSGALAAQHTPEFDHRSARTCWNEPPNDDVFLQAFQSIGLAVDGRLGQHPGRLLERGGRDKRARLQRRLGDP